MPMLVTPSRLEPLDDRDLVFRLAEPAAVVIERQRAADFAGFLRKRTQLGRCRLDPSLLLWPLDLVGSEIEQNPELGLDRMALEQVEDDSRFAVQLAGRDPERVERDAVPLERFDLGVERGDVLAAPVVGEVLEPQLSQHGRALFGPAFLAVKRDDAPGDQVVAGEEPFRGIGRCLPVLPGEPDCGRLRENVRRVQERTKEEAYEQLGVKRGASRSGRMVGASSCNPIDIWNSAQRGNSSVWWAGVLLIAGWPREEAVVSCRLYAAYGALDVPSIVSDDEAQAMKTAQGVTLIANGRLVDGTGAPPVPDAAVLIKDGKITYAGPAAAAPAVAPDVRRIDARGGTILPGLVEAHFHRHVFRRGRAGRSRHQVSGRIRDDPGRVQRPAAHSNAATRRPVAAAACTISTCGSRRRSRKT